MKRTKNSSRSFIFDLSGFYGPLCIWHRNLEIQIRSQSVWRSGLFSYKFSGSGNQHHVPVLSHRAAAHLDFTCNVRTSSTSRILSLIICLALWRKGVVRLSHTDPHLAKPAAGKARLRDVFSRSQIVPLDFITVWSLFCGGIRKAVIGSRWGGPCMPPWWCQRLVEKHGGLGVGRGIEGGACGELECLRGSWLPAGLQVGRMRATPLQKVHKYAHSSRAHTVFMSHYLIKETCEAILNF